VAKLFIGDKMPNFFFDTIYENGKSVYEILGKKERTVFWILRYIGCTTCRYDVHVMSLRYQEFIDLDAQIYVVMQSEASNVRDDLKEMKLPFDIICDPKMEIYQKFEIPDVTCKQDMMPTDSADLAKLAEKRMRIEEAGIVHGKYEGNELQLPAFFVIERDGTVSYAHYAKNIIDMPTVDEILNLLREIKSKEKRATTLRDISKS